MQTVTFCGRRMRKPKQVIGVSGDNDVEHVRFIQPELENTYATIKLRGFDAYDKSILEPDSKGWVWTIRAEHIESYGTIYGQIEILAGEEMVWQSYIFPIELAPSLDMCDKPGKGQMEYLKEIERALQQKASMEDLEAYTSRWEKM